MEEILASIRRIISEDGDDEAKPAAPATKPAAAKSAPPRAPAIDEEEDVLELTDIVPEEEPVSRPARVAEDDLVMVEAASERPPARAPSMPRARVADESQLISDQVREQASSSFMALARDVLVSESDPRSLEALIQEMLRPMLQNWLNQHLPSMVEGLVQQEIERVTRRGQY
jgi:cell pole-organizing protein PopZ